jgi:multidrug efflux system membrane fusion protein
MRATYLWAIAIAIALLAWLGSGQLNQEAVVYDESIAQRNIQERSLLNDQAPTQVRVVRSQAQTKTRVASVRGKTENKRTVQVRTELQGRIVERGVERGQSVAAGDLLCALAIEDRHAALVESQQQLAQARIDFDGAKRLKAKGYNSESAIAAARARLASTQAELKRRELTLQKTRVTAPFAGFVEDVHLEVGDFATPGAPCITLVDQNPMLLVGRVSERVVQSVKPGMAATGIIAGRESVSGPITFVGQQDDPTTRTYAIEIELNNEDGLIRSGLTTEIRIPVAETLAHKVSPALFSLDDRGGYGIKVVNDDNIVEFYTVSVVSEDADGVWVQGLPNAANVITVGQELVVNGERVDPVFVAETLATSAPMSQQVGS